MMILLGCKLYLSLQEKKTPRKSVSTNVGFSQAYCCIIDQNCTYRKGITQHFGICIHCEGMAAIKSITICITYNLTQLPLPFSFFFSFVLFLLFLSVFLFFCGVNLPLRFQGYLQMFLGCCQHRVREVQILNLRRKYNK